MYRTIDEEIDLFKIYADQFEKQAVRSNSENEKQYLLGKSRAYENAAFELEHNLKK